VRRFSFGDKRFGVAAGVGWVAANKKQVQYKSDMQQIFLPKFFIGNMSIPRKVRCRFGKEKNYY
jgi:hypothetical protein